MNLPDLRHTLKIVSLTTISSRVDVLGRVIQSLLNQTVRPDIIYLNISEDPFFLDKGLTVESIPPIVRKWIVGGSVRLTTGPNIGPYRKLLPALYRHRNDDCVLVTADDDVIYPESWLSGLIDAHVKSGGIAAYRCRLMIVQGDRFAPYNEWPVITAKSGQGRHSSVSPSKAAQNICLCPTGRDGILYRPEFFPDLALLERLRTLAPTQDDLALRAATLLAGVPVEIADLDQRAGSGSGFAVAGRIREKLGHTNTRDNDVALGNILNFLKSTKGFRIEQYSGVQWPPKEE